MNTAKPYGQLSGKLPTVDAVRAVPCAHCGQQPRRYESWPSILRDECGHRYRWYTIECACGVLGKSVLGHIIDGVAGWNEQMTVEAIALKLADKPLPSASPFAVYNHSDVTLAKKGLAAAIDDEILKQLLSVSAP